MCSRDHPVTLGGVLPFAADPEPTADPVANLPDASAIAEWFDGLVDQIIPFLIVLVFTLVAWFVGVLVINGITRGIERGAPLNDARTRQALSKARIRLPKHEQTVEERLEGERRRQRAGTLRRVLKSALAIVLVVIIVMVLLAILGVPVGPMLASAGIVGVALGFGAQSLVKDVLSGTFMLMEDQYGVGDVVDLGEAVGSVEEVGLRSTRLRALDGTVWYIPNGEITRVGNMTRMWSRVMLEVRFAYDTDVEVARQAMIDAVTAASERDESIAAAILDEPEVAGIESLEYNAVMLRLLCQTTPAMQWAVQREVRLEMRRIFAERGIRLAVPGDAMVFDTKGPDTPVTLDGSETSASAPSPRGEDGQVLPPAHDTDRD